MSYRLNKILKWIPWGLVVIVAACFSKPNNENCDKYRKGKFYIYDKVKNHKINIERKDSIQIETNEKTGDITILKVKWTDTCEYELLFNYMTPKEVSKREDGEDMKKIFESMADIPLQMKILSGTDSYYIFEARKKGLSLNMRDTVWLIK